MYPLVPPPLRPWDCMILRVCVLPCAFLSCASPLSDFLHWVSTTLFFPSPRLPSLHPQNSTLLISITIPIQSSPPSPQTKCDGSRKFAIPSLIKYSCPQFAQTNFPFAIVVSISSACRSFIVCDSSSCNSSDSGAVAGRAGRPS